jgi:L-lactate utilization protein LutB
MPKLTESENINNRPKLTRSFSKFGMNISMFNRLSARRSTAYMIDELDNIRPDVTIMNTVITNAALDTVINQLLATESQNIITEFDNIITDLNLASLC